MNGLTQIVEAEFDKTDIENGWFVFISRDKKKVKIIYWRDSGLAMWQYRLEKQNFEMGKSRLTSAKSIDWNSLGKFLDGLNIFEGEKHEIIKRKRCS